MITLGTTTNSKIIRMIYIDQRSDILSNKIGKETVIGKSCAILPDAHIGNNRNICAHVFILNDVIIDNNETIKNGVIHVLETEAND